MSKDALAIAILRAGRSYDEAAQISGLTVAQVMDAWAKQIANPAI